MGYCGGPTSMACGGTQDIILSTTASILTGGKAISVEVDTWGPWRGRYLSVFQGGVYVGRNIYAPLDKPLRFTLPVKTGDSANSIYIEDAGQWSEFSDDMIPRFPALAFEALSAKRLSFRWTGTYSLSTVRDDTQLSSITITGAQRNVNCELNTARTTRAKLSYSITSSGTTRYVRWWNGANLVAEGSRVGNGAVTCSAVNSSGLSVTCTITYSADLAPQTAYIELHWPASYYIHYSTTAATIHDVNLYLRTPEKEVLDSGSSEPYIYQTGVLVAGSYYYQILQVDDEGNVQTTNTPPADEPLIIKATPAAPTITSVTGNAAALVVNFTNGEAGCTYNVYSSKANTPINFGSSTLPAVITTALNATSATLAAIADYTPHNNSADYTTLKSSFDSAVSALNSDYALTASDFLTEILTFKASIITALQTYASGVQVETFHYIEQISNSCDALYDIASSLAVDYPVLADWQDQVAITYQRFLGNIGNMLANNPGLYSLPDGTVDIEAANGLSLYALSFPASRPAIYRVIVRATKSSIQETNDIEYKFELDSTGAIVALRPAVPGIVKVDISSSYLLSVTANVINDENFATSEYVDFYIVSHGGAITASTPTVSVTLGASMNGLQTAVAAYTVGGNGHYDLVVASRTIGGQRSDLTTRQPLYISNAVPSAPSDISAEVSRNIEVQSV